MPGQEAGGQKAAHVDLPFARRVGRAPSNSAGAPRVGAAVDRRGAAAYIPSRLKQGCSRLAET